MNEEYSGIRHQPIDANNFELEPASISMFNNNNLGAALLKIPIDTC